METRKLIEALSPQGQQKPRVPTGGTPERMGSSLNARKGEGSEAAAAERPLC